MKIKIKIEASTRLKITAGADSGFPAPTLNPRSSSAEDSSGHELFAAEDDSAESVIAPTMSYKDKNEKEVERQQNEFQNQVKDKSSDTGTKTSANTRLKATSRTGII